MTAPSVTDLTRSLNASYHQKRYRVNSADRRATAVVRATRRNRQGTATAMESVVARYQLSHAGKVYGRRFVSTRLAAALLAVVRASL